MIRDLDAEQSNTYIAKEDARIIIEVSMHDEFCSRLITIAHSNKIKQGKRKPIKQESHERFI